MKHYSLLHDMPTHYILHDSRDKRVFEIAKHGLDDDTHEQLRNLPPMKQFKGYDNDRPSDKDIPGTDSMALKDQPQKKINPGNTENFPESVDQRSIEEQPQHYSQGGPLTSEHRNNLANKSFALPSERKYPINDINHARNALSRASQNASSSQQSQIKAAVHRKFPSIQHASEGGEIDTRPSMEGTQLESLPEAPLDIYTPTPLPTPEEEHRRHIEVPEAHEESYSEGGIIGNEPSAPSNLKEQYDKAKADRDSRVAFVKGHRHPAPEVGKPFHYDDGGTVQADSNKTAQMQESMRKAFHFADGTPPGGVPNADKSDFSKLIDAHHKLIDTHAMNLSAQDVDPNAKVNVQQNPKPEDISPQINQALAEQNPTPEQSAANLASVVPGVQQAEPQQRQRTQISEDPTQAVQASQPPVSTQVAPQQAAPQQTAPVQQGQSSPQQSNLDKLLAQSQEAYQHLIEKRRTDDQRFGALVASKTIDPNQYFNNQNLGQKLAAGLGMGLASVGAAVSHMPNQAMQVMSDAINRDIDAQKNDQSHAINLWKMNNQSLGDEMAATLQTRNQMLEAAKVKMDELLGNAPGPMAAQKAAALKTQIQLEQEQNNAAITQAKMKQNYLSNMGGIGGNPAGQHQESPESHIQKLSMAGLMSPEEGKQALKEIGQAKLIESLRGDMQGSFDNLNSKLGAGILTPGDRKSATNAFSSRIQHIFVGRFNENSAKQEAEAIMPQPFDSPETRANRQQRFDELFDSGRQDQPTLQEWGVKVPKGTAKPSQYNTTAILTPTGQTKMVPSSQLNYYLQHGAKKVE